MTAHPASVRENAVARVRAGEPVAVVAAASGVHPSTIRRWVKTALVLDASALAAAQADAVEPARPDEPAGGSAPEWALDVQLPEPSAPQNVPHIEPAAESTSPVRPADEPPLESAPAEPAPPEEPAADVSADEPALESAPAEPAPPEEPAADVSADEPPLESAHAEPAPPEEPVADLSADESAPDDASPDYEDRVSGEPTPTEQLQALAAVPGDVIVRFAQRRPYWLRYLTVVVVWLLSISLSTVAPQSHPGRPWLVGAHLLAMTVSFGSVIVLDWHGVLWESRQRDIKEAIRLSHALSPLIWGGLGVLLVTGGLLAPNLSDPRAWIKLSCVLLLALNGVAASQLRRHLATGTSAGLRSLRPGPRSKVVAVSLLSQGCWLAAVIIGMLTTLAR